MPLPNFLIIGANKSGTTSLYNYLKQHPQVYMSPVKEPMFFSLAGQARPPESDPEAVFLKEATYTLEEYQALFAKATTEVALGEASTSYMASTKVPETIKHYLPDARLIAILRHPVERAYSSYRMYRRFGIEPLADFGEALEAEAYERAAGRPGFRRYRQLGFYYHYLEPYFACFPRSQLQVHLFDDLSLRPRQMLRDIFRLLQVDDTFVPNLMALYNTADGPVVHRQPPRRSLPWRAARRLSRRVLPARWHDALFKLPPAPLSRPPEIDPAVRARLLEDYRPDILKLQELIGRDLSAWLK